MNNYQKHLKQISKLKGRPQLLVHVCCGVCSVFPLVYLRKYFDLTIFFSNSNIYPYEEFERRLDALKQYLQILDDPQIKLIIDRYDNDEWIRKLSYLKNEPEGGIRCRLCYRMRMENAFRYASDHHYPYCTTIMSISNRKNADWINEIGAALQISYPEVEYLYADFKKNNGINENNRRNRQLNLYHQCYCGCIYSLKESQKRSNG